VEPGVVLVTPSDFDETVRSGVALTAVLLSVAELFAGVMSGS
jgi:hypothetical protein